MKSFDAWHFLVLENWHLPSTVICFDVFDGVQVSSLKNAKKRLRHNIRVGVIHRSYILAPSGVPIHDLAIELYVMAETGFENFPE